LPIRPPVSIQNLLCDTLSWSLRMAYKLKLRLYMQTGLKYYANDDDEDNGGPSSTIGVTIGLDTLLSM